MAEVTYLWPTPKGVYYLVTDPSENVQKAFIREVLRHPEPLRYESQALSALFEKVEGGSELLPRLMKSSWLQLLDSPPSLPEESPEALLEQLLEPLSDRRVLLLEEQGFYLASKGFPHEIAEPLAALGAELIRVYEHHRDLLEPMLQVRSSAWSLVDAGGLSRLGFWLLYIDNKRFGLVIEGVPMLNHPNFVLLVWQLLLRYGETP